MPLKLHEAPVRVFLHSSPWTAVSEQPRPSEHVFGTLQSEGPRFLLLCDCVEGLTYLFSRDILRPPFGVTLQ